jgi:hypothetical protein
MALAAWDTRAYPHGEVEMVGGNGYNAVRPINLATQAL